MKRTVLIHTFTLIRGLFKASTSAVLLFVISLAYSHAEPTSPQRTLHIIFDTHPGTDTPEITHPIDIRALRLISGTLPPNPRIQLWHYQAQSLTPLKPVYTIQARNRPTHKTISFSGLSSPSVLDALNHLLENIQESKTQNDIILLTPNHANGIQLDAPETTHIANRLIETRTRFSVLQQSATTPSPLYKLLTTISHGWHKSITHTEVLEQEFINFLERFSNLDYIPLHETLMKIDSSINEVTLVLFKNKQENHIEIIPPLETPFSKSNAPDYVKWLQTQTFDLINISKPSKGTWQVFTDNHHNNRIIIDSTLQLEANKFDSLLPARSFQSLNISLIQNKQRVINPEVMDYVAVKVTQLKNNLEHYAWFPADNGKNGDTKAKDGLFSIPLKETLEDGEYTFLIDLDGKKFQRQLRRSVIVSEDLAWIHQEYSPADHLHTLYIIPYTRLIKPESILINASVRHNDGTLDHIAVQRSNSYAWVAKLQSAKNIEINIAGTRPSGKTISIWLPIIALNKPDSNPIYQETQALPSITENQTTATTKHSHGQPDSHSVTPSITLTPISTIMLVFQLILVNSLVGSACFFGYRSWKKRTNTWYKKLEGQLSYD